ncbi:hypothetical protein BCV70DRAFT_43986 [Testicularia cyperi]|uniref:Uncharacterized protein n=1 Tax=Testicularia cyperi TaxID=1882483 RepID=A0A317XIF0_9BASI|nr:hypothetical protein BCV70DRAFT_43986 [Testicularia cyperi]
MQYSSCVCARTATREGEHATPTSQPTKRARKAGYRVGCSAVRSVVGWRTRPSATKRKSTLSATAGEGGVETELDRKCSAEPSQQESRIKNQGWDRIMQGKNAQARLEPGVRPRKSTTKKTKRMGWSEHTRAPSGANESKAKERRGGKKVGITNHGTERAERETQETEKETETEQRGGRIGKTVPPHQQPRRSRGYIATPFRKKVERAQMQSTKSTKSTKLTDRPTNQRDPRAKNKIKWK